MTRNMVSLIVASMALVSGCQVVDPGGQVQSAHKNKTQTGWGSDGNFRHEVDGSQENNWAMYEGHFIFVVDENGLPMLDTVGRPIVDWSKSAVTSAIIHTANAEKVATGLDRMAQASTEQWKATSQMLESFMAVALPLVAAHSSPVVDDTVLRALVKDEVRLALEGDG